MPWDLVVLDEAHRLRNVYKPQNVTANKLKNALKGRKKLLLTATPLQNNLMELYGLVSFIDEHVFGDAKTFREMYVAVNNAELRNRNLRDRLSVFCKRTLRKQVTEYVRYTERHAILQEYTPTKMKNFYIILSPAICRQTIFMRCLLGSGRLSQWCCENFLLRPLLLLQVLLIR